VEMWIAKHRGPAGPATVLDGALNGAETGVVIALLPTLALFLVQSSNPPKARAIVILIYVASAVVGTALGAWMAKVARDSLDRSEPRLSRGA
jgi:predicted permease